MEYAAARSTLCRQCGKHFLVECERAPGKPGFDFSETISAAQSLLHRVQGAWQRPRITSIACFDCGATQELNSAATSTICPSCSVHMDLRDYRINTAFSRAIRTHGSIYVTSAGDLSSSSVVCRCAIIEGKLRGSLQCIEKVEFRASGKVQGKLTAPLVIIGRRAEVQFFRQLQVGSIEVRGRMVGEIVAETVVTIRSHGALDGNVVARAINVEKGGTFTGQLVIGQKTYKQAELLPDFEASKANTRLRRPPAHPFGLPATS